MFIQRRGSKALCPRFTDCILVPQFFDSTEATFCDRHNPFDKKEFPWPKGGCRYPVCPVVIRKYPQCVCLLILDRDRMFPDVSALA